MSVTRMGATKKYSDNWENIFGSGRGRSSSKKAAPSKPAKQSKKKKSATSAKKSAGSKTAKSRSRKKSR